MSEGALLSEKLQELNCVNTITVTTAKVMALITAKFWQTIYIALVIITIQKTDM